MDQATFACPAFPSSVKIFISHSAAYAALYLPSLYTEEVSKTLEFEMKVWRARNGSILTNRAPPYFTERNYTIPLPVSNRAAMAITVRELKQSLASTYGVPLSVQHHLRTDSSPPQLPLGGFNDEATLAEVWTVFKSGENEAPAGVVDYIPLVLSTTARFLETMNPLSKLVELRYYWSSQKYLKGRIEKNRIERNNSSDSGVMEQEANLEKLEALERSLAGEILSDLSVWNSIVHGVPDQQGGEVLFDSMPLDERTQELEYRVYGWALEKQEFLKSQLGEAYVGASLPIISKKAASQKGFRSPFMDDEKEVLEFDFPAVGSRGDAEVFSQPVRFSSGELDRESSSFDVHSGVLLWGQLSSIYRDSKSNSFLGNAERIPKMLEGGTIAQWMHEPFRCAARNGKWTVRKMFTHNFPSLRFAPLSYRGRRPSDGHIGWVISHVDYDPLDIVERCSRIGKTRGSSLGNVHVDKDVLFINRYDWPYWHRNGVLTDTDQVGFRDMIQQATGVKRKPRTDESGMGRHDPARFIDSDTLRHRLRQHMSVLDAAEFSPEFVTSYIRDCPLGEEVERIFYKKNAGEKQSQRRHNFGAYVVGHDTEYEFAWLVFSGKKHNTFDKEDELIAIVYDSAYQLFEGYKFGVEPDDNHTADANDPNALRWKLPYFFDTSEDKDQQFQVQS